MDTSVVFEYTLPIHRRLLLSRQLIIPPKYESISLVSLRIRNHFIRNNLISLVKEKLCFASRPKTFTIFDIDRKSDRQSISLHLK
jgi:hypothetical protein